MFRKTFRLLCFILYLTISFALLATEMTYQEKKNEMSRLISEYKTKTGFEGQIKYYLDTMTFRSLEGHYKNIQFDTKTDRGSLSNLTRSIFHDVQPYLGVPLEQIIYVECHETFDEGYSYKHIQKISGIGFAGGEAAFDITFEDYPQNTVQIINQLVIVDNAIDKVKISKQQAIDIMLPFEKQYNARDHNDLLAKQFPPIAELRYCKFGSYGKEYFRLCWYASWEGYVVEVHAITGEALRHFSNMAH